LDGYVWSRPSRWLECHKQIETSISFSLSQKSKRQKHLFIINIINKFIFILIIDPFEVVIVVVEVEWMIENELTRGRLIFLNLIIKHMSNIKGSIMSKMTEIISWYTCFSSYYSYTSNSSFNPLFSSIKIPVGLLNWSFDDCLCQQSK